LAFSALWARRAHARTPNVAEIARAIPPRPANALRGSQFADLASSMDRHQRERAIQDQLAQGNLPDFLRTLVPVNLRSNKGLATIFVMPEYVAIGSDSDFLRIPMNLHTAVGVANRFGFLLPTRKIVDAIYAQSTSRCTPQPLPAGPEMSSTHYYATHNSMIDAQLKARGFSSSALIAGHKKDVVLSNRLVRIPGRIAIYGWHRAPGMPIQPLSTVHGSDYADYSHGIRLIASIALVDGKMQSIQDILRDPARAAALSDEGAIPVSSVLARA